MGIHGLLPLLKSIMVPIHVKDLRGCVVAVDTYSWLHKGALSCSKELCKGLPTTRHIDYCMHRVNLLRYHGVKPILVFDGGHLPMKTEEEIKRARGRKESLERAIEHEAGGNYSAAYECYQKAVDISPSVALELIEVLKQQNVDYVVAPYEADAQMTFLALAKHVDIVITEDSDLIPFGCPRIIFKMDKFGQGVQFEYSMLHQNKELDFTGFTKQMLLEMCILSGCDYLQSLPGMGLKRAHALIRKFKSYDKVIKHVRYNNVSVPPLYEESFKKALWAFQHQRVYDPATEDIVHLTNIPYDLGHDLDFLGPMMPQDLVKGIAKGDVDPITKLPFQGRSSGPVVEKNYLLKDFKPDRERKQLDLPVQKNVLTNYFCSASLEAKKKFKAPRVMLKPLHPVGGFSPLCEANDPEDATTSQFSKSSLLDSENFTDDSQNDSVENGVATDGSQSFESPEDNLMSSDDVVPLNLIRHAVYKPCPTLHKDCESKLLSDEVEGKTRSVSKQVNVRSSYFQHKVLNENGTENKHENLPSERASVSGILCEETVSRSSSNGIGNPKVPSDEIEGKMRSVSKKVIVRSSYFQHKVSNENSTESKNENLPSERATVGGVLCKETMTRSTSNGIGNLKSSLMKRKSIHIERTQSDTEEDAAKVKFARRDTSLDSEKDTSEWKHARENTYLSSESDHVDSKSTEMDSKIGNFGCNISHLNHYSDVAEKSMEKFVSVISSFRCTSSGSRASGLRAPLKDVRNTLGTRLTIAQPDLNKFSIQSKKAEDCFSISQKLSPHSF